MNRTSLSLYIFNSIEDEWRLTSSEQSSYILSDSYLYMNVHIQKSILITPIPVSPQFKEYVEQLAQTKIATFSPIHTSYSICKNIIQDKKLFTYLLDEAKKNGGSITIRAYVSTPELHLLKDAFVRRGITIYLPENTDVDNLWTIDFFGSKAGFRSQFSHFMPEGTICYSISQAIHAAKKLYKKTGAIVIKTNKGNSGEGVVIMKNKKNPRFAAIFSAKSYWEKNPIIVEEFIDTSPEKYSRFPSIECFVTPSGKVTLPYYCNMIVTKEGEFYGIEMHKDSVNEKVKTEMDSMTMFIGKAYARAGFRGRFDVDYLYDGKKLYANESNTRTNGGTDTYFITRKLVGDDFFSSRYVLSSYLELRKKISMTSVLQLLSPLLYNNKTKSGFILGSENALQHKGLSFILIGKSKRHVNQMVSRMNIYIKSLLTIKKNEQ